MVNKKIKRDITELTGFNCLHSAITPQYSYCTIMVIRCSVV